MAEKMTKRGYLAEIKTVIEACDRADKEEIIEFIDHEIELMNKRNQSRSENRKPTKTQQANVELKKEIVNAVAEAEGPVTVSDLLTTETLKEYSSQKISALLKQLVTEGEVVRTEDKKKAYFSIA